MNIISIGMQCTNAALKRKNNINSKTFPFDWMLSNPKFIFEMLELLLNKNMNIKELVEDHFFVIDKKVKFKIGEHYYIDDTGNDLYNKKYNVIFPHDKNSIETINKYIRRFERLKDLIINSTDKLYFIYSSQSSSTIGNFTINNINIIHDVYYYLSKIYTLIGKYNNNYKIIMFDAIKEEDKTLLNKNIILYELNSCYTWSQLIDQIPNFISLLN